jgi:hypothetical protein
MSVAYMPGSTISPSWRSETVAQRQLGAGGLDLCQARLEFRADFLRRQVIETLEAELVAQHAQYFPGRPRLADRARRARKACQRPSQLTKVPEVS